VIWIHLVIQLTGKLGQQHGAQIYIMGFSLPIRDKFLANQGRRKADKRRTGRLEPDLQCAQKPKKISEFLIDSKNDGA
jgi:hypothetical protein